jgi:hypothetical protein
VHPSLRNYWNKDSNWERICQLAYHTLLCILSLFSPRVVVMVWIQSVPQRLMCWRLGSRLVDPINERQLDHEVCVLSLQHKDPKQFHQSKGSGRRTQTHSESGSQVKGVHTQHGKRNLPGLSLSRSPCLGFQVPVSSCLWFLMAKPPLLPFTLWVISNPCIPLPSWLGPLKSLMPAIKNSTFSSRAHCVRQTQQWEMMRELSRDLTYLSIKGLWKSSAWKHPVWMKSD